MTTAPTARRLHRLRSRVWTHPRYRTILLTTCLVGMFSTTFPATILTVSVKLMADELGTTPSTVAWVTTAPMLAAAVATPILGRLGDIRGHRRLYFSGFVVAITFALLTALAWDATSLIAFRTVSQFGAAATIPSSFAMVFRAFPPAERVRASAVSSATLASAAVSGLVVGGPLVDAFGWRPIFVVQAAIGVLALLPSFVVLKPDEITEDLAVDYPGAAALAVAAFTITFGLNRLAAWGPTPFVLANLVVAPFAVMALVRIERRAPSPLLPASVLGVRGVLAGAAASFVLSAAWMGNFLITPLLLQSVMGLSAGMTSLVSAPRATFIALSAPAASRLGMRYRERRVALVASILLAAVFGLMAVGATYTNLAVLVVCLALSGWMFGHISPPLVAIMGNSVDEKDFGLATSLQQTAGQIGGVFGVSLFTAFAADAVSPGPFVATYVIAALLCLVCAYIVSLVPKGMEDVVIGIHPVDDGEIPPVIPEQVVHPDHGSPDPVTPGDTARS